MTQHRKPEFVGDEALSSYLQEISEELFVFHTGGVYNSQDGSARSMALKTISEVQKPILLRELIQRAARIEGKKGIEPAIARQGIELHQNAKPCVYWLLRRDADGSFRAFKDIPDPDGYQAISAGDLVLDKGGDILLKPSLPEFKVASKGKIDRTALGKLKGKFLSHFSDFEDVTFSGSTGSYWEEERSFKQDLIDRSEAAVADSKDRSDAELGAHLLDILLSQKSNLLGWRMKQRIVKVRNGNKEELESGVGSLVRSQESPETAVADFVKKIWPLFAKENEGNLPYADLRSLPTMLLALAKPNDAIGVRYQLFHNAGTLLLARRLFQSQPLTSEEYASVLEMSRQLFRIMSEEWEWQPRDLWDVQGFIWSTCNDKQNGEDLETKYGVFSITTVQHYLTDRYSLVRPVTQYMAGFKTKSERPIGLDRGSAHVTLFLEPGRWERPGVELIKEYDATESRHSNLQAHAPGIASGNPAVKVRIDNWSALVSLCDDYDESDHSSAGRGESERKNSIQRAKEKMQKATNLILYGPPGTGKTYATAAEAIRLCGINPELMDRQGVMSAYRDLVKRRRIEFVTFHQSYSYEDFVEGLRPETSQPDEAEKFQSGGFRLVAKPGVFLSLSERAQASKGSLTDIPNDLSDHQVFKMSLGRSGDDEQAYIYEEAVKGGYVLLGYGGKVDWSERRFDDFEEIRRRWLQEDPTARGNDPNIQQIYALRSWMKEGDLVVVSDGNKRFRAIGMVTGPYRFVPRERDDYSHQRPVRWLWSDDKGLPREDIYERGFSQVSIYNLSSSSINWPALTEILSGGRNPAVTGPEPYVLIIDEINRANISKVFGELITLIEPDKRVGEPNEITVTLPYSGKNFGVPSNLHIIGTMNTADRSIALLDTALRRRFQFRELLPDHNQLEEYVDGIPLREALQSLNCRIEYLYDRDHQIGHAYFMGCETRQDIDEVMRSKVIPLLVEYFYEDWEKVRSVLNEKSDSGSFVTRIQLLPPSSSVAEESDQGRWRYVLRNSFELDAYLQLTQ